MDRQGEVTGIVDVLRLQPIAVRVDQRRVGVREHAEQRHRGRALAHSRDADVAYLEPHVRPPPGVAT
jgi:hypothetical protein